MCEVSQSGVLWPPVSRWGKQLHPIYHIKISAYIKEQITCSYVRTKGIYNNWLFFKTVGSTFLCKSALEQSIIWSNHNCENVAISFASCLQRDNLISILRTTSMLSFRMITVRNLRAK